MKTRHQRRRRKNDYLELPYHVRSKSSLYCSITSHQNGIVDGYSCLERALEEQTIFIWKRMCYIEMYFCNVSTFIFSYSKLSLSLCYWFGLNDFHGDSHGMWDDKGF